MLDLAVRADKRPVVAAKLAPATREARAVMRVMALLAFSLMAACPGRAEDGYTEFLHAAQSVRQWSLGAFDRPSTFMWAQPVSPLILGSGSDPRKEALTIGSLIAQTRFLNIRFDTEHKKNFLVFASGPTRNVISADFLMRSGYPREIAHGATAALQRLPECGIIVIPNAKGQIELVLATNLHPYEGRLFTSCMEMLNLRGFGVYLRDDRFAEEPDPNPAPAYKFLHEIYRSADRSHPLAQSGSN